MSAPVPPLGSLASFIISEAPALLERSLKYEVEGNMLYTQCTVLKGRLEIVKRSISNERDKQQVLLSRLATIRNMLQDGEHTVHEFKYPPLPSNLSDLALDSSFEDANATQSDGSPVSLQTKRKAIVIDDDDRVLKRLKRFA